MAADRQLTIGIGACAGGVDALQAFFRTLPEDSGLSFVVIMSPADGRTGAIPEILASCTTKPIHAARDGLMIEPDNVYVLGSNGALTVRRGQLTLQHRPGAAREPYPIDLFFASLAEDAGENAVGILLSGVGSDGTRGARSIKKRGGLTIAQHIDGKAVLHPEMLPGAVAAGAIDLDIPIEAMGAKLLEYAQGLGRLDPAGRSRHRRKDIARARQAICEILLDQVRHDFSGYKEDILLRRVERRVQLLDLPGIEAYIERLRRDSPEVVQLFRDLLIGETAFFRDRDAFDALAEKVIPRLFAGKGAGDTVRIWVPGCATGEEAYSLLILLLEHLSRLTNRPNVQCFASDIDDAALAVGRAASYPAAMLRDVEPERVERYFRAKGSTFTVAKEVRDLCIFSSHSIIRDPPFARMDLIACRNLLAHFDGDLQRRLVPVLHYALRPGGHLFLGGSENLTRHRQLFAPIDKRQRIFLRRDNAAKFDGFPLVMSETQAAPIDQRAPAETPLRQSVERRILDRFAPAHVVVDRAGDIVHCSARTSNYLEIAAGAPTQQVVEMARPGLRLDLRSALDKAIETRQTQTRQGLAVAVDDRVQTIDLTVEPLPELDGEPLFLIVFTDVGAPGGRETRLDGRELRERTNIEALERELRETRDGLELTVEEYQAALEELRLANEELVATNEELQSTNENLESSREDSRSINEELGAVNSELRRKIEELGRSNDDLRQLFESSPIGAVFLDRHMVIRTFTPAITSVFNLIPGDRGRPLTDIVHDLEGVDLREEIEAVLRSRQSRERRVARRGRPGHYLMSILPDPATGADGGAMVSFIDITLP